MFKEERYIRQQNIPELPAGLQDVLRNKSVLLIGAGGLGCPIAIYLAAAGIGRITIVDRDTVQLSNLNRQILYNEGDIGKEKAVLCAERVNRQNPECITSGLAQSISDELLSSLMPLHDVVIDACDNYEARLMIAKSCKKYNKECIIAAVNGLQGFVMTTCNTSACFACIYPKEVNIPKPQVLGSSAGCIGSFAVTKCILALTGKAEHGIMFCIDMYNTKIDAINIPRSNKCPLCWNIQSERQT